MRSMRALWSWLLVCAWLGTFTSVSAAVGTLRVIESLPSGGEELSLDEPIALYFDRPVNCDTASDALSMTPTVIGSITCDETQAAVIFAPEQPLESATVYTLTLSMALRGEDGARLDTPFTLELQTTGFLRVTQFIPADGTDGVQTDSTITVLFNRPVVPLLTSVELDTLPHPLIITPNVEGEGEWLNTSTYVFQPTERYAPGEEYTVSVSEDLQAVDGARYAGESTWHFTTIAPQIVNVNPQDGAVGLPLTASVTVYFNQPIDKATVESNFHLTAPDGTETEGTFEWGEDNTYFTFSHETLLELDTLYTVSVDAEGIASESGGATLTGTTSWSFKTVPYPTILGSSPRDGDTNASGGGIAIYFSAPVNEDTVEERIHIDPEPENVMHYYQWSVWQVSFPAQLRTTYSVTVDPGIEDLYGNVIEEGYTFTFTTAPAGPALVLNVPSGMVGFYNAYNEDTAIYLTQRNVNHVGLELYSVPVEDFINIMGRDEHSYEPEANYLVRAWEIDTVGQEDTFTPSYVSLSNADSCPNAPPSRIHIGDGVEVAAAVSPLDAFASPFDEHPRTMIYTDFPLNVVGGPTCSNDMWWWEVQLSTTTNVWIPEGDTSAYWLDVEEQAQTETISVTDGDALAPGVYYLRTQNVDIPDVQYSLVSRHFMMVMTANIVVKSALNEVMVWATDVNTSEPIANTPITLYRLPYSYGTLPLPPAELVAVGSTDENGLWTASVTPSSENWRSFVAVLQTDTQVGIGASYMADGIDPGMFNYNAEFNPPLFQTYAYTDRQVYRPGQRVYFRAIFREDDDLAYSVPDINMVRVSIRDSSYNTLFEQNMELSPFGTVSGMVDLAADAPVGYYSVTITLTDGTFYQSAGSSFGFSVAEYRLPEFSVAATPVEAQVVQDDTIHVDVASTYYFGGPVSDANVDYTVVSQPYFFRYTGNGRYSFIPDLGDDYYGYYYYYSRYYYNSQPTSEIANGTLTADAQGRAQIELPAALEDGASTIFRIEATVTDQSQQAVSGRTQVIIHASELYVGVATERYIGVANDPMQINLIAVDWDSVGVARQSINVEVVEERWYSVQEVDSAGRTHWVWEMEEVPIMETAVNTDEDGKATSSFTPPDGGSYLVRGHITDSLGNTATSETRVWVSSREYVAWRQSNNNRIDLITDRDTYQAGDTAEILITSPFQGVSHALITVERGSVIEHDVVTLDSNSYVYRLPITVEYAPDVFVSVMIVKGVDETNPVASFRMGLIQLMVDTAPRQLNVSITSDVEQAAPDATVNYTVRVTDYNGDPVSAEVGVALTDLASLAIAADNQPPLLDFFYRERGIGVRTSTPLTMNTDELTQNAMETIKGGGGGVGNVGIIEVREDFVDTSYWNASLVTDEDGVATFSVTLPDNLTTWRLDARALTAEPDGVLLVGQSTHELISTRPLIVRPVTPRFFTVGDVMTLAAVVNNNTDESLEVDVGMQAQGLTFADEATKTVTIEPHQRARVEWSVTVQDVEGVTLVFTAQSGEYQDASAPTVSQGDALPVYRYEAPEVIGTAGMISDAGEWVEGIALPRRFEVTQGELTINLQTSLAAATIDGLDYLSHFRDECIEGVVSAFLPNILTYRALVNLDLTNDVLRTELDGELSYATQRLYSEQLVDGGWDWCGYSDTSSPIVTAYALIGLTEAETYGVDVRAEVIIGARQFLYNSLIVPDLSRDNWELNRQAFVLYALARSGVPDVARTANLYDIRERLSLGGRAFLALTLNLIDPSDTSRTDAIISDFNNAAVMSATGVHWEESYYDYWNWGSDTRSTALILMTLVKLTPDSPLVDDVVRWLITMRGVRCWSTTQETAWALMAFTDWMVHTGELHPDYDYSVTLNGDTLTEETATDATIRDTTTLHVQVSDLLADDLNALTFAHGEGDGSLYYTAHLRVYMPVPEIDPLSRGIVVERRYVRVGAEDVPVTEAYVGETLQVRLTIIAPNNLHYVTVTDPLPAGVEAVNPNLQTSQQIGTQAGITRVDPRYGWGWWWFSRAEFHDESVVLRSSYLAAGTYEYYYTIRAGLPGVYNVIPTTAEEAYFPEVYGRSEGMAFTILPLDD
jgi:alpha-2-macroglobulin